QIAETAQLRPDRFEPGWRLGLRRHQRSLTATNRASARRRSPLLPNGASDAIAVSTSSPASVRAPSAPHNVTKVVLPATASARTGLPATADSPTASIKTSVI